MINGPLRQVLAFANLDATNVALGIPSPHGYEAIFKNNNFLSKIRQRLENMYQRQPLFGLLPLRDVPLSPRFACVTPDTKQKYQNLNLNFDPWEKCGSPIKAADEDVLSFYVVGTAYIFLCDEFVRTIPPGGLSRCPQVFSNKFDTSNFRDLEDQTYDLIYSLNRFYLGRHALDANSHPVELFDWNECVQNLDAEDSFYNPTSLVLYSYCKWSPKVLWIQPHFLRKFWTDTRTFRYNSGVQPVYTASRASEVCYNQHLQQLIPICYLDKRRCSYWSILLDYPYMRIFS